MEPEEIELLTAEVLARGGREGPACYSWARVVWLDSAATHAGCGRLLNQWIARPCAGMSPPWHHNRIYALRCAGGGAPCRVRIGDIRACEPSLAPPR